MVRVVLLGLLAASAGCTTDEAGRLGVTAGMTVGSVVEVTGKVTATRAAAMRELTVGSEVSGDDVIETAADGSVAIDLAHNNARWNLGAGKKARVSESVAWGLPKAARLASAVTVDTTAAGRHAEHTSAETAASATQPPVTTVAPKTDPVAPDKSKPDKIKSSDKSGNSGPGLGREILDSIEGAGGLGGADGVAGLGLKGTGTGGGGVGGGVGGIGTVGTGYGTGGGKIGGKGPDSPSVRIGPATISGSLAKEIVTRVVRLQLPKIKNCYQQALLKSPQLEGRAIVKLVIGADGKVVSVVTTGIDQFVASCISATVKTLAFPAPGGGIVIASYPIVLKPGN